MKTVSTGILLLALLIIQIMNSTGCSVETTGESVKQDQLSRIWKVGEKLQYSSQSIYGDIFITGEYLFGNGLEAQYITVYNLKTREKTRVKEIPVSHRLEAPAIRGNMVVWSECILPPNFLESPQKDFDLLDWNIYLLNLETGEEKQITKDVYSQYSPRISDDFIVWLDLRHEADREYPHYYDVYAYDLHTGEEIRITTTPTVPNRNLSISGNLVVWADARNDTPEIRIQEKPPIFNHDIYCYDFSTGKETQITTDPANDSHPSVDNGYIVWSRQFGTTNGDVYLHDVKTGQERQISTSGCASRQRQPGLTIDFIVWGDSRLTNGQSTGDIYVIDTDTGTSQSGSSEIFLYDLKSGEEIRLVASKGTEYLEKLPHFEKELTSTAWQILENPVIHNGYIVYTDARMTVSFIRAMKLER